MCTFVQDSVNRYVRFLLHEYVNDSGLREDLSRSGGFCREHAWSLLKTEFAGWHDGMGTALLHEQILGEMLEELDEIVSSLRSTSANTNTASPTSPRVKSKPSGSAPSGKRLGTNRKSTRRFTDEFKS